MGVSNREEGAKEEKEMEQKMRLVGKIRGGEVQNGRVDEREGERSQKNGKRENGEGEGFKKKKCVNKVGIGFQKQSVFQKQGMEESENYPRTHTCTPHLYKSPPSSRKRQEGESSQTKKKRGEREVTQGRGRPQHKKSSAVKRENERTQKKRKKKGEEEVERGFFKAQKGRNGFKKRHKGGGFKKRELHTKGMLKERDSEKRRNWEGR